eukprot:4363536-Prymnesium_polylepis.1
MWEAVHHIRDGVCHMRDGAPHIRGVAELGLALDARQQATAAARRCENGARQEGCSPGGPCFG